MTRIKYILDKTREPLEQDNRYQFYTSLGFRPEIERTESGIWIKYYPPQATQETLEILTEDESASERALMYVRGDYSYLFKPSLQKCKTGLNYVFVQLPAKLLDTMLSYARH